MEVMIYFQRKVIEDIMKIVPILFNVFWNMHVLVERIRNINLLYFIQESVRKVIMVLFAVVAQMNMEKLIKINAKNVQIQNTLYLLGLK